LSVQHGGQIEVGTDAVLVSGDGGDGHPNATDGGNGGSFIPLFLRMSDDSDLLWGMHGRRRLGSAHRRSRQRDGQARCCLHQRPRRQRQPGRLLPYQLPGCRT
jgi:hypothetical protein